MTTGYHFFHLGPIALRRRLSTVLPFTLLFKTKSQLSINFLMTTGYHFFHLGPIALRRRLSTVLPFTL
jgi:hypothetical protein